MAPDDHNRLGALSREMPCTWCGHGPHRYFVCDDCPCGHNEALGIDTALLGG